MSDLRTRIDDLKEEAEEKAWEALSGYKFWMFGYHAAKWVQLNQLLDHDQRQGNPFADVVRLARERIDP